MRSILCALTTFSASPTAWSQSATSQPLEESLCLRHRLSVILGLGGVAERALKVLLGLSFLPQIEVGLANHEEVFAGGRKRGLVEE